jgi:hypothetical protein
MRKNRKKWSLTTFRKLSPQEWPTYEPKFLHRSTAATRTVGRNPPFHYQSFHRAVHKAVERAFRRA